LRGENNSNKSLSSDNDFEKGTTQIHYICLSIIITTTITISALVLVSHSTMTKIPLPPSINTMSTSSFLDDNNVDDDEEITFEFIETPKASSTSITNDDERKRATDFVVEQAHQPEAVTATTATTNNNNAPTTATTPGNTTIIIPPRSDDDVGSSPPPVMNRNRVSGTSRNTTADDDDDDDALLPTTSTTLTLSSSSSATVVPPTTTSSSSKISTATAAATATNRDTLFGVFRVCSMVMMMMMMMVLMTMMMMMMGRRADHSAMDYVSISPPIGVPLGEPPSHDCHPRAQAIDTHARAHAQQLQQLLPEQQRQQEQEHQQTEFEKRIMSTVKSELQAVIQSFTSNMIQRFNAQLLATAAVKKAATEAAALSAETSTGGSTSTTMGDTTSSSSDSTKEVKVNIAGEASQPTTTATSVIDDTIEKKAASLDRTGSVDHRDNCIAHQSVDDSATTTTGLKDKQQQQQQHQRMGVASRHYLEFALWIVVLLFIVFNLCKCCGGRRRHNVTFDNDTNKRRFGRKRQRLFEVDDFDDQLLHESLLRYTPSPLRAAPTTPRGGGVMIDLTKNTIREIPRGGYRVINANRSSNFPHSSTNSTTPPPIISKEQARANAMIFAKRDKQRLEEARGTIHTGRNNSRDNVYTTRTISPSSTNNTTPVVSKQQARENAKIYAKRDQQRIQEARGTSNNRGRDTTGISTGTIPSSSMSSKILKREQARANALKFAKRDKKRLDDAKK
jgi:uncharacterized membrane protein